MLQTEIDLNGLLVARITHDLISPLGAVLNGLELMALTNDKTGAELDLVSKSAGAARDLLAFFRTTFGTIDEEATASAAEAQLLWAAILPTQELALHWHGKTEFPRKELQLLSLAALCLSTLIRNNAQLEVNFADERWSMVLTQEAIPPLAPHWQMLHGNTQEGDIAPSWIEFPLFASTARKLGREISYESKPTTFTLSF